MVIANFYKRNEEYKTVTGLWQYDYGQVLRIQGLDLPPAVEIHFSLTESGAIATRRIGVTKDGVTDVVIPDSMLEVDADMDYPIYAFVYKSDSESGETVHRIKMSVKSRPKPEAWSGSGETTVGQIMEAVNQIASEKADGLEYKDNILKLLSGEKEIARVTIKGGSGSGADAREIELQKGDTAIQWRYVGDAEWIDLISLAEITGADGKSAYQYALQGGYTGSEADFAVKLAAEYLTQETDPTVPSWAKQPQKPSYTAAEVGAEPSGAVSTHNTAEDAHNDIRILIEGLTTRLNAIANSEDVDLDQLAEIVTYIKSNRSLIDSITTSKVSVSDIIDNLTTNVENKPLSAAQGVALKSLIDAITIPDKLPNPYKLTFSGGVTAEYDGSGAVAVTIPDGSGGTATERIEKGNTDTAVELQPNKLYIFPEMSDLSLTFADQEDTTIANEYHCIFRSGATATTLTLPDTIQTGSFSVEANKIYEVSVLENCLTYQSWDYTAEVTV